MVSFLHHLGLFLLRFVTGALVCFFAAREMADRSTILLETLEFFSIAAPDIVKVFVGCIIMLLGGMLVVGFWTRFVALVLLILLATGGYCWLPQESQIHFQIESLYGILLFYLFLVGGGQWAVSRRRTPQGQSVLDSEQSILASASGPSIFGDEQPGESVLTPPVAETSKEVTETEDEPVELEKRSLLEDLDEEDSSEEEEMEEEEETEEEDPGKKR